MSWSNIISCTGTLNGTDDAYSDGDGTALAALLGRDRVRLTEVGTPVAATNWHDRELGNDDGSTDGRCDFLGRLDSESDMALAVSDDHDGLEASTLTSTSLLLHGLDLYEGVSLVSFTLHC